ncbi:MAG: ABA4-like family protein [Pseudomonadota bacterium]
MNPETIFSAVGLAAMTGWLALLASPFIKKWAWIISGAVIPLLLSVAYTGLIFAFWSGAEGGFDTLANVQKLFEIPELALAGWIHFLAFDLFVGVWVARTAAQEKIRFWFVIPCLFLTFMFGPAGFLAFTALRLAHGKGVLQ